MGERVTIVAQQYPELDEAGRATLAGAHPLANVHFVRTAEEFAAALPGADGALAYFPLTPPLLAGAPRLRWFQAMYAGVDRFWGPEIAGSPVVVTATKGPMAIAMAEHMVALMLTLTRRIPAAIRRQQEPRWEQSFPEGDPVDLHGKTLVVLGTGGVGGEVARIGKLAFGMRTIGLARTTATHPYIDTFVQQAQLHEALAVADVVALAMPITATTARIIDAAALAAMKPTAYLVNVSRGKLVDEAALAEALAAGRLAGAGLDVFSVEPLPTDHPLWRAPRLVITPHVSQQSDRKVERNVAFWAENIRRFAAGEPLQGLVDKALGY